jgi:hypothetical protein
MGARRGRLDALIDVLADAAAMRIAKTPVDSFAA